MALKQKPPAPKAPVAPAAAAAPAPVAPDPIPREDEGSSNEAHSLDRAEWNAVEITRVLWKCVTTPRELTPTDFVPREIEERVEKYMKWWEDYLTQDRKDKHS